MARLLFLIADTGGGHRASANAVARRLQGSAAGVHEIRVVDPFAQGSPPLIGGTANLYGPITRHARWAWGALYHATDSRAAVALLERTLLRLVVPGIVRQIRSFEPHALVSFHPLLNHAAVRAVRDAGAQLPVLTVITDLVDVHAAWACAEVDAVVVPSAGGFERCRRAGIPSGRCHDLGLPVDVAFTEGPPAPDERADLRRRLGLNPDAFLVLICGGADGSGRIARLAAALARAGLAVDIAVICGRNARALRSLQGLRDAHGRAVVVRGFVDNMAEWVRASDVIATKAGPGTVAEALCCGVPMLLTSYLPGQERGNVEWLADVGAGRYVPRTSQFIDAVTALSDPQSAELAAMRNAVRLVARPDATARIARLIERFVQPAAA